MRLRRGVTLVEMLVVLVLMAITSALVVPALRGPSIGLDDDPANQQSGLIQSPESDPVIALARRSALKRGEPLRLRVASDGAWILSSLRNDETIDGGRITKPLTWQPDLTVDAVGMCILAEGVAPRVGAASWDPMSCRWREARQ